MLNRDGNKNDKKLISLNSKKKRTLHVQHTSFVHFFVAVLHRLRACLHEGGGPQVGEVTRGGSPHLSCKRDQIKIRDHMESRFTPPKRITLPTLSPSPPCKQAISRE